MGYADFVQNWLDALHLCLDVRPAFGLKTPALSGM